MLTAYTDSDRSGGLRSLCWIAAAAIAAGTPLTTAAAPFACGRPGPSSLSCCRSFFLAGCFCGRFWRPLCRPEELRGKQIYFEGTSPAGGKIIAYIGTRSGAPARFGGHLRQLPRARRPRPAGGRASSRRTSPGTT